MRLIDADKVRATSFRIEVNWNLTNGKVQNFKAIPVQAIENAETVDAEPVVHEIWIKIDSEVEGVCKCSGCKFPVSYFWGKSKYCPNCGAKMDGEV